MDNSKSECGVREYEFVVGMRDEDLIKQGYDPKNITDEEFEEIVETMEVIFQEEGYYDKIFKQACREVLLED